MADNTHIEWTDATWDPIVGCSVVSPGCTNCYAMRLAGTRLRDHPTRAGLTTPSKAGPVWNGQVRFNPVELAKPLSWRRPRRIFVCAHGDLFHEAVTDEMIDQVFAVMALSPQHTFQVLTKRAARMRKYLTDPATPGRVARAAIDMALETPRLFQVTPWPVRSIGDLDFPDDLTTDLPLPNVWLGVSAEDQPRADERILKLLTTPASVRFVSLEPLLGPVYLLKLEDRERRLVVYVDSLRGTSGPLYSSVGDHLEFIDRLPALDWVIVGGESGQGARPMHPDWARQIRDDCADAGVPFFFKQWGEWSEFDQNSPRRELSADDPSVDDIIASLKDRFALVHLDGRIWRHPDNIAPGEPARLMLQTGKRHAGRLLDGVEHSAMPEPRP